MIYCDWRMAPVCWLDMACRCRWHWVCNLHDRLLTCTYDD